MKGLIVYTSQPASLGMATFLMAVHLAHDVAIRPLSELPRPDSQRRQNLRTERVELRKAVQLTEHFLAQYRAGERQPDADNENGLRRDLEHLQSRLRVVEAVLSTEQGGADND